MRREKFVIKTGAGDYLERGYPRITKNSITISLVSDIERARIFYEYRKADEVRKSCFMGKSEIVKLG